MVLVQKAAIKKMDMQASKEFLAELKVLTNVHHLNLVMSLFIFFLVASDFCVSSVAIYAVLPLYISTAAKHM